MSTDYKDFSDFSLVDFLWRSYRRIIFDCEQKIRERKDWKTFSKDPLCVTWVGVREEVLEMKKWQGIFGEEFVACMDYLWKVLARFWEKCKIYELPPPENCAFAKVSSTALGLSKEESEEIEAIYQKYSSYCDGHLVEKNKSLGFLLSEVLFPRIWEEKKTPTMKFCLEILVGKLRTRGLNLPDFSKDGKRLTPFFYLQNFS